MQQFLRDGRWLTLEQIKQYNQSKSKSVKKPSTKKAKTEDKPEE